MFTCGHVMLKVNIFNCCVLGINVRLGGVSLPDIRRYVLSQHVFNL